MVDQTRRAAYLTTVFHEETYELLSVFASLLARFGSVPVDSLQSVSGLPKSKLLYEVEVLLRNEACVRSGKGYRLTMLGLDTLALHEFSAAHMVDELGPIIAKGKESDVYEAVGRTGVSALKFFRMGRISFRQVERKRGYFAKEGHRWLVANIRAAAREASILKRLSAKGVPVPKPIGRKYHVILMDMKLAIPLYKVRELEDAKDIMWSILKAIRWAYRRAGVVNGDLSEYNILITPSHDVILIDWPQAVKSNSTTADELLKRDLTNVLGYFSKRFSVEEDLDKAIKYVRGPGDAP